MGVIEKFFREPMLDLLYDAICIDFEKAILEDKNERQKYYDISAEEDKLHNMMIEIVGNEDEKIKKLMGIIRELEDYCCKETEYWNKKYFKLGFSYLLQVISQKDRNMGYLFSKNEAGEIVGRVQKNNFSVKVHDFLDKLRENSISNEQKNKLFQLVNKLEKGTKKQKRRFSFYYNLINNEKIFKVKEIAEMEKCDSSAIRPAVSRITSLLVNSQGEIKEELEKIIDNKI